MPPLHSVSCAGGNKKPEVVAKTRTRVGRPRPERTTTTHRSTTPIYATSASDHAPVAPVLVDHGARPAELVFTVGIYSLRVKFLTGLFRPPTRRRGPSSSPTPRPRTSSRPTCPPPFLPDVPPLDRRPGVAFGRSVWDHAHATATAHPPPCTRLANAGTTCRLQHDRSLVQQIQIKLSRQYMSS